MYKDEQIKPGGDILWTDDEPSAEQLEQWIDGGGGCEAVGCGCWVEPDGTCECGNPSWLLHLGMI